MNEGTFCIKTSTGFEKCFDKNDAELTTKECVFVEKKKKYTVLTLIFISLLILFGSYAMVAVFSAIGIEKNPTNLYISQQENHITYTYSDSLDESQDFILHIEPMTDEYTLYTVEYNAMNYSFYCEYETGYVLGTEKYTIFWVFNENLFTSTNTTEFDTLEIIDPIGLYGEINGNYTMKYGEKFIYMNHEKNVLGTQLSYTFTLYDDDGNLIGNGCADDTSGLLEQYNGNIELTLTDPDTFLTSRHRETAVIVALVLLFVIPLLIYIITKNKKFVTIAFVGELAIFIDFFVDVWYYAYIGYTWTLIIHVLFTLIVIGVSSYIRVPKRWLIPLVIEWIALFAFYFLVTSQTQTIISFVLYGFYYTYITVIIIIASSRKDEMVYQCE